MVLSPVVTGTVDKRADLDALDRGRYPLAARGLANKLVELREFPDGQGEHHPRPAAKNRMIPTNVPITHRADDGHSAQIITPRIKLTMPSRTDQPQFG